MIEMIGVGLSGVAITLAILWHLMGRHWLAVFCWLLAGVNAATATILYFSSV